MQDMKNPKEIPPAIKTMLEDFYMLCDITDCAIAMRDGTKYTSLLHLITAVSVEELEARATLAGVMVEEALRGFGCLYKTVHIASRYVDKEGDLFSGVVKEGEEGYKKWRKWFFLSKEQEDRMTEEAP